VRGSTVGFGLCPEPCSEPRKGTPSDGQAPGSSEREIERREGGDGLGREKRKQAGGEVLGRGREKEKGKREERVMGLLG